MHTAERLDQAVAEARRRGFEVRMEPLCGTSGGLCEFGRRHYIFVDLTLTVVEQLEQVRSAMRTVEQRRAAA